MIMFSLIHARQGQANEYKLESLLHLKVQTNIHRVKTGIKATPRFISVFSIVLNLYNYKNLNELEALFCLQNKYIL